MKKLLLPLLLFTTMLLPQHTALARDDIEGYYYSYTSGLSMSMYYKLRVDKYGNRDAGLSITIRDKNYEEICDIEPQFENIDGSVAFGGGYSFTLSELSPALIIKKSIWNSPNEELACGRQILGTYANLCPSVESDMKQMSITIKGVYDPAETVPRTIKYMTQDRIEKYAIISTHDVSFFQSLKGKTVNARYKMRQYYDEHDSDCIQRVDLHMVDGVTLK